MIHSVFCDFATVDFINFQCQKCGRKIRATEKQLDMPKFLCLANDNQLGNILQESINKVKILAAENIKKNHGDQVCTDEQIANRFAICSGCEYFKNNLCQKCGCPIARELSYSNKLVLKDSECPIGKWSKI
jgi:hypothetical protein